MLAAPREVADANGELISEWYRSEVTEATNPKYQYELQYKGDFKDHEDHMLLFSALGNFFGKDQSSEFFNETRSGLIDQDGRQETRTNFKEAEYTLSVPTMHAGSFRCCAMTDSECLKLTLK